MADNKFPVYKLTIDDIDEDSGVDFIALVDAPATDRSWMAFNNQKPQKFSINEDKRIITGAIMVSDLPIFRKDEKMGEYFVTFGSDVIRKIVYKFFKKESAHNVNLMHDGNKVKGVYMFESWIVDKEQGKGVPDGFKDMPDGSWFGSFRVENDDIWNELIKTGALTGFSIEGIFNHIPTGEVKEENIDKVIEIIQGLSQKIEKLQEQKGN